ncbi:retrotransposable element Tf2 [Tanacetum coccineum]
MRIEESLNGSFDKSLPEPKSSSSVEDDRIDEPIIQDLNGSPSLQVNVLDEGYPKSLKEARGHLIEQVIGELNERTLRKFGRVLNVSYKGTLFFAKSTDTKAFMKLKNYHPSIPSKSWEKHQLHPHLNAWVDVLLSNEFVEIEAQESLPIIVGYMLYCIQTKTPFNFAYFIARRLSGLDYNNEALLYAKVMTTLFEYLKNKHPNDASRMIEIEEVSPMFKPKLVPSSGLLQPLPIPKRVWTHISMDFVDGLPMSKVFLENVYKLHGLPKVIVSDRDAVFLSRFWTELFRLLQVGLHMSTSYHPQTDGWSIEYWYNTSFHTSINTTPYQVLYGQAPPAHVAYTVGDSANELDRMKAVADKKRTERVFGIHDLVLLKLQPYRQSTLRQHKYHKLALKYYGSFKIIARIGNVPQVSATLPQCDPNGVIALEPFVVLDKRMTKKGNVTAVYVLMLLVDKKQRRKH